MDRLIVKIKKTVEKYNMIQPGDRIIVGVSGGADSICLLDILNLLRHEFSLTLIIAHINHGIRNREAEIEARFVRIKAFYKKLPFEQLSVSVPTIAREKNLSIEQTGRNVRNHFFKDLLQKYQAQKIALGHHADDQVETILMRIIRGSGLRGLTGIPPVRNCFIRPLIECSRQEVEAYCRRRKIAYCVDSSNRKPMYLRNKIRNQLIPLLARQYNPSICNHLLKLQTIIQDEFDFLEEVTEECYWKAIKKELTYAIILDSKEMSKWPVALQRRVIRKGLRFLKNYLEDIQFVHIESIRQLCLDDNGEKYLDLPGGIRIRKSYRSIVFGYASHIKKPENLEKREIWEYSLPVCQEKKYPQLGIKMVSEKHDYVRSKYEYYLNNPDKDKIFVDYDKLKLPLKLRNRRPGDRFKPLNSKYFKKIKAYFIDLKIPLYEREKVILVVDCYDRIVWIVGFQIDDRFKITRQTEKILQIHKKTSIEK